jgi:hypothetical protein
MMKQIPMILTAAILASALGSCANADDGMDDGAAASTEAAVSSSDRRCIFVRDIDNYHPIDRNHVVISDRSERTHLLGTMRPGCWDIQHSTSIALETAPISLCEGQTATLMVSGERCYIRTLEAVSGVEAAEALVEERAD